MGTDNYMTESQLSDLMSIVRSYALEKNCPKALSIWHEWQKHPAAKQRRYDFQKILAILERQEKTQNVIEFLVGLLTVSCMVYAITSFVL